MKLLDRYIFASFIKAWLICFLSLISLYVVIDAFNNIDDLMEAAKQTRQSLVMTFFKYYGNVLILFFDRLCPIILPMAAAFTVSWIRKNNELLPLLAAGVPLHHLLRPIYLGCIVLIALQMANREFMLPRVAQFVESKPNESMGQSFRWVNCFREPNGMLLDGRIADPNERMIKQFSCTIPSPTVGVLVHIQAREAYFYPAGSLLYDGTLCRENIWLLTQTTPSEIDARATGGLISLVDPGKFMLKVERADFRRMTRVRSWYQYCDLFDLMDEMNMPGANQLTQLAVQFHQRMVGPLLTLMTVTISLGLVLRDQAKNIFMAAGACLIMGAVVFAITHFGKYLGERETLSAPFAAWLPLVTMGPLAFVLRNSMHT